MQEHFEPKQDNYTFSDLRKLIAYLRSPDGCPWDRKQDLESLQKYLLEESYESVTAFYSGNTEAHCEELGDVLLQVVFQTQIAAEDKQFNLEQVIDTLVRKLVQRHSHVFGEDQAADPETVKELWQRNKAKENESMENSSLLRSIKRDQSPLHQSYHLQKEAAKYGFDWPDHNGAAAKVLEELEEVKSAQSTFEKNETMGSSVFEEVGDLLFAVVNLARKLAVEPETALAQANNKFIARFRAMEKLAQERGDDFSKLSLEEQDTLWNAIKRI